MAFTKENAAMYAIKGNAVKWSQENRARNIPEPLAITSTNHAIVQPEPVPSFRDAMMLRVRKQIKKLQTRMDEALDADEFDVKSIRDLAEATNKLESVEQRLSGRPLPGTLKPSLKPPKQSRTSYPEPEPQYSLMHEAPKPVPVLKPDAGLDGDGI